MIKLNAGILLVITDNAGFWLDNGIMFDIILLHSSPGCYQWPGPSDMRHSAHPGGAGHN